jgi:hypothetical protein
LQRPEKPQSQKPRSRRPPLRGGAGASAWPAWQAAAQAAHTASATQLAHSNQRCAAAALPHTAKEQRAGGVAGAQEPQAADNASSAAEGDGEPVRCST